MALGEQNWREVVDVLADLAIIIGALTGGVWTLLTFTTLRSRQRAEAELRNIELNNERQAVINIELKSKQVKLPGHPYYHIETIVHITNAGNTNALLLFRSAPLIVTEAIVTNSGARPCGQVFGALFLGQSVAQTADMTGDEDRLTALQSRLSRSPESIRSIAEVGSGLHIPGSMEVEGEPYVLRVGMRITLPFVVAVQGPGLYHVLFLVDLSKNDQKVMAAAVEGRPVDGAVWTAECFVKVRPNARKPDVESASLDMLAGMIEESLVRGWDKVHFASSELMGDGIARYVDALYDLEKLRFELRFEQTAMDTRLIREYLNWFCGTHSEAICADLCIPSLIGALDTYESGSKAHVAQPGDRLAAGQ